MSLNVEVPQASSVIFHPLQHIEDADVEWPAHPAKAGLTVPVGTANVARGMPVRCDPDVKPTLGALGQVTDGEKCGAEECILELPPGLCWVQIDLGASTRIFAVTVWHAMMYDQAYRDVVVQVSDDAEFKEGVTTIFNNSADGSAGLGEGFQREYADTAMGRLIDAKGVRARYVRLYANGSRLRGGRIDGATHWTEVEVYGTPTVAGRAFLDEQRRRR